MKQLLCRMPDNLHSQLKEAAAQSGESMNTYVVEVLSRVVEDSLSPRERLRQIAKSRGMLSEISVGTSESESSELPKLPKGASRAILEALEVQRHDRT